MILNMCNVHCCLLIDFSLLIEISLSHAAVSHMWIGILETSFEAVNAVWWQMTQRLWLTLAECHRANRKLRKNIFRKIEPESFLRKWHSGMTHSLGFRLKCYQDMFVCSSRLVHAFVDVIVSTVMGFHVLNLSLGRINLHIYCFLFVSSPFCSPVTITRHKNLICLPSYRRWWKHFSLMSHMS